MTAWDVLDLAPTDDKRAIRRAYADLLKNLDVDGDPDAFERLRRARDWALTAAEAGALQHAPLLADGETIIDDAPPTPAEPMPDWLRELTAHHSALMTILSAGDGKSPTDDETQIAMVTHFEALLRDPRLADVGFHADAERWFAQTIAHACPRADPLILPAAHHFNWLEDGDQVGRPDEIVWLTRRGKSFQFLSEVQQKGHPYHREWLELCVPADESSWRGRAVRRKDVLALLAFVRGNYPGLESCFDWYRVSLWEKPRQATGKVRWAGALIWLALIAAINIFGSHSGTGTGSSGYGTPQSTYGTTSSYADPTASDTDPSLANTDADIDAVLRSMFGRNLTAEMLARENPKLYAILRNYWKTDKGANIGREQFGSEIHDLLIQRFPGDIRKASYPLVSGFRRFELDQLQEAAQTGYGTCDAFLAGKSPQTAVDEQMEIRRNALIGQILLHADDGSPPPKIPNHYLVSGAVIARAIDLSGLTQQQFASAMKGQGTSERGVASRSRC